MVDILDDPVEFTHKVNYCGWPSTIPQINCSTLIHHLINTMLGFKSFYESYVLVREAAQDKINKLEKITGVKLDNLYTNLIKKKENEFDWNKIFSLDGGEAGRELQSQVQVATRKLWDSAPEPLQPVLKEFSKYTKTNNYHPVFTLLFASDFIKKYKNTTGAVPAIQPHVIGDLYTKAKELSTFGNLVKMYKELDKESTGGEGGALKNQWVKLESQKSNPDKYEENLAKLQSYSSCKTGWCVRGEGMAKHYLKDDDFHLYLDEDGDAVVSLRMVGDEVQELSGTADGSKQNITEDYFPVTIKYVNDNGYKLENGRDIAEFLDDQDPSYEFTDEEITEADETVDTINGEIDDSGFSVEYRIQDEDGFDGGEDQNALVSINFTRRFENPEHTHSESDVARLMNDIFDVYDVYPSVSRHYSGDTEVSFSTTDYGETSYASHGQGISDFVQGYHDAVLDSEKIAKFNIALNNMFSDGQEDGHNELMSLMEKFRTSSNEPEDGYNEDIIDRTEQRGGYLVYDAPFFGYHKLGIETSDTFQKLDLTKSILTHPDWEVKVLNDRQYRLRLKFPYEFDDFDFDSVRVDLSNLGLLTVKPLKSLNDELINGDKELYTKENIGSR